MKPSSRHFVGIDLGTSSCSVSYVVDDARQRDAKTLDVQMVTVPVDAGGNRLHVTRVPSIVAAPLDPKARGGALFGFEFGIAFRARKKDAALLRRGRDFFTSVKSDLGTLRAYTRSRVAGCRTPLEVTTVILDRLRGLAHGANAALDLRKAPLVITVPASFSALARTETLDAAAAAGFDRARVRLLDEPVAALLDLLNSAQAAQLIDAQPRNLLVFDYGAGTCDVALLRVRFDPAAETGLHVENLAISNYHRLGGDDIDGGIMADVVWPQICTDEQRDAMSISLRRDIEDTLTGTVARRLKELMCTEVDTAVRTSSSWAKIDAEPLRVVVPLERVFEVPGLGKGLPRHFEMTSDQFREVMAPFLSRPEEADDAERSLLFPVQQTLTRAGLKPDALHAVVLHGGSSLNPYVQRLMRDTFGKHDLFRETLVEMTPDPLDSVARGAAVACYWREAKSVDLVSPIMPEDFGVVLRDGRRVPLVAAGTPLPFPDADGTADVHDDGAAFAVPADGLATLLVPYYTGSDRNPRLAGTIKVPLPGTPAAGTPIRISVRVEEDKTLKWWFRVGDGEARLAPAVDDPWTSRALTVDERKLMTVRRSIRDAIVQGRPVTHRMLVDEANAMHHAGDSAGALLAIEDAMAGGAADAGAHNAHGLILNDLLRHDDAAAAYLRASQADPANAVYLGNYGVTLLWLSRVEPGIAALRRAIAVAPDASWLYLWLGSAYRQAGDETRALVEYRHALDLVRKDVERWPLDSRSWSRMESVCQSLGDYRGAAHARAVIQKIERDALYEGDSRHVIAGASVKAMTAEAE